MVHRVGSTPWAAPRRRAEVLRDRHDFATEALTLYLALLEVWEQSWAAARSEQPASLAGWAGRHVLPDVVAATAASGPERLADSLLTGDLGAAEELLTAWLAGEELVPVERYLARATLRGPLAALGFGAAGTADPAPRGDGRCPHCGGQPQLSFRSDTGDRLVSGRRRLQCARCAASWSFSASACAYCGETEGARRTVFAERGKAPQVGRGENGHATFPHLRVEACAGCRRYLIDVDLGRDPHAVPEVDELAALPLDLYAAEQGFSKITPNLMGW
ncbi:formate dehydrogenase accessory protein FdhE domain-containing protein [Amycolatopsis alkalitolerans]|uniref:Formate dehydrogenase accessory protein FdhE n=1 Tax=Amycolatopsis alkalitolerans TaxID=2547244 RepID=A0A5C4M234_9PSEU|nr:formate dehydrogenase accessory protein FdhE [Amycolatopsis alkalitolerans]TNC25079.1 formate dehydrogenase accessory protein FdhE [Amycolatopsis alkalitolerans]